MTAISARAARGREDSADATYVVGDPQSMDVVVPREMSNRIGND
jgi:hypothetical protein